MIEAKVICDSTGAHSPRLTTFLTRYPKFVHAEHCRHRTHSFCVSSSRAIPVSKNLQEVMSDELRAGPVYWGAERRGMQSGEELSDEEMYPYEFVTVGDKMIGKAKTRKEWAALLWKRAALDAANTAALLQYAGAHKSIVNRLIEPFLHVNVLVTSCESGLLNFFGLRLDKAAQPEIRALAEAMWVVWNESEPQPLKCGDWHIPFISSEERTLPQETAIRVSVARCARLSYTSFETGKRSMVAEDLALYARLLGAQPIHASPAEHQATPDEWYQPMSAIAPTQQDEYKFFGWQRPELHGNLTGWVQHRKQLSNEAVAPLPQGYAR